ncbi:Clp R domain-containing protein [Heracleum sosnowskyi]|uniref:Clp R domain-containing protein n=1 Tax=Heracleum sosnowskyi TaxID=360622 RepID=A0AAD8HJD7_9APIA|nr:Clp R domain-containing protein [Heracleum sosnowskyi]
MCNCPSDNMIMVVLILSVPTRFLKLFHSFEKGEIDLRAINVSHGSASKKNPQILAFIHDDDIAVLPAISPQKSLCEIYHFYQTVKNTTSLDLEHVMVLWLCKVRQVPGSKLAMQRKNQASKFLRTNGITLLKVREEIVKLLGKADIYFFSPEHPPLTEEAQRALDWAIEKKLKSDVEYALFLPIHIGIL